MRLAHSRRCLFDEVVGGPGTGQVSRRRRGDPLGGARRPRPRTPRPPRSRTRNAASSSRRAPASAASGARRRASAASAAERLVGAVGRAPGARRRALARLLRRFLRSRKAVPDAAAARGASLERPSRATASKRMRTPHSARAGDAVERPIESRRCGRGRWRRARSSLREQGEELHGETGPPAAMCSTTASCASARSRPTTGRRQPALDLARRHTPAGGVGDDEPEAVAERQGARRRRRRAGRGGTPSSAGGAGLAHEAVEVGGARELEGVVGGGAVMTSSSSGPSRSSGRPRAAAGSGRAQRS